MSSAVEDGSGDVVAGLTAHLPTVVCDDGGVERRPRPLDRRLEGTEPRLLAVAERGDARPRSGGVDAGLEEATLGTCEQQRPPQTGGLGCGLLEQARVVLARQACCLQADRGPELRSLTLQRLGAFLVVS